MRLEKGEAAMKTFKKGLGSKKWHLFEKTPCGDEKKKE